MKEKASLRVLNSSSDNRKPVLSFAEGSAIANLKWLGISTLIVALTVCGALARAQQPAKVSRVAFLSLPSSGPDLRSEAFRQGLHDFGYTEGQTIPDHPVAEKGNGWTVAESGGDQAGAILQA